MSDFDSGNYVNCVLLDISLYETKGKNNWSPIPVKPMHRNHYLAQGIMGDPKRSLCESNFIIVDLDFL